MDYLNKINEAITFIKSKIDLEHEYCLLLDDSLEDFQNELTDKKIIYYKDIPNFISKSDNNKLISGKLNGKNIIVLIGKSYLYEGYDSKDITLPIRVISKLGTKKIILTCDAGSLNRKINVGDFLLVSDQINLTGFNPLTGHNYDELGIRFPVMFDAYTPSWRKKVKEIAIKNSIYLYEGVYAGISGPNFVSRAELRYLNQIGADCVGMSLVQEAIASVHSGMELLGISAITSSDLPDIENYDEEYKVIENYKKMSSDFIKLLKLILSE